MKTKIFITILILSVMIINANAQIKVFSGGNVSIKSTNTPTYGTVLQVFGSTIFSTNVTPTSGPYIQGRSTYSPSYASPDFTWYGNLGTGISHPAQDVMTFTCAGLERVRIDNGYSGRVSISGVPYYNYPFTVNGSAFAYGGTWQASDMRYKENIKPIDGALNKVLKLNGKSYVYKTEDFPSCNFSKDTTLGFIAQEIVDVIPEAVRIDSNGYYSMNYDEVIPVLVEAIKEQEAKIEQLQSDLLKCCSGKDKSSMKTSIQSDDNSSSTAILYQNIPNPFSQETKIKCDIPDNVTESLLYIYNMQGTQLKKIQINGKGSQTITIMGSELKAGMYMYTLIIDGKEIDTKKMILTD